MRKRPSRQQQSSKDAKVNRDPNEYNVRAIERALQILECFDDDHPARGVSEISEAVGLHKATTHRLITTLANHGYLERLPGEQRYRLGMQLATLGLSILRGMDLRREAVPYIANAVARCEETCDLSVFDRGEALIVEVIRSRHVLAMATSVGQRLPLHATATGKVFLAYLPEADRDALLARPLKQYTSKTITDPDALRREAGRFIEQGYAFDDEEYEVGVRAISAPIRNSLDQVFAVVSMPGPVSRITEDRISEIAGAVMETASAISHRLGWRA
jgi:IclR family transcriptional regulator, KDG regulon repressor